MIKNLKLWQLLRELALIHFGCMLYAFTWASVVSSADGIGGGASGLAMLIQYATGLPMGIGYTIINGGLVILAIIILGRGFGIKTIFGIASIALWLNIFPAVIPHDMLGLADDKLLSAILAGVLSGIGVGICLLQGGSTGGTDIVAMIINKFRRVSYGRVVLLTDFAIIGSSWFVYHNTAAGTGTNPLAMIIYGYVLMAVFSYTVDTILAGNKQSSQIFIFSRNYAAIAAGINHTAHRGVTIMDGVGAYTGQSSKMLVVLCRKHETSNILRIVKQHDPEAFVSVGSVMGVYGKGFDDIYVKPERNEKK